MTLELRRQHYRAVAVLALLLPGALGLSLALRTPIPAAPLPAELQAPKVAGPVVWTGYSLWPREKIVTRLRRNEAGEVALELSSRGFTHPDLLLYWAPGKNPAAERLPPSARFLGAVQMDRPIPIPDALRGETGTLILYSLAAQEIAAVSSGFILQKN